MATGGGGSFDFAALAAQVPQSGHGGHHGFLGFVNVSDDDGWLVRWLVRRSVSRLVDVGEYCW